MKTSVKWGIGIVAVAGLGALGVVAAKKQGAKPVEVRIEAVESRDLVSSVQASGQIQPRIKVNVSSDLTGKIVRLAVRETCNLSDASRRATQAAVAQCAACRALRPRARCAPSESRAPKGKFY